MNQSITGKVMEVGVASANNVPFVDLTRDYAELQDHVTREVMRVLLGGWYVLGEEGRRFEESFAQYLGIEHCIGCGSGTDALILSLMALGVARDDEVITVSNTAVPTVAAIVQVGARPVFLDIDEKTGLMDVSQLRRSINARTRAILPVHLYGGVVEMTEVMRVSHEYGIPVIEDCAQAAGAEYAGRKVGTIGHMGAFSFYPTKNLGCYGDGGAVVTNDAGVAEKLRMLRFYGQKTRYSSECHGINSRLDELQAAVLNVKLQHLDDWNERRRKIASTYIDELTDLPLQLPVYPSDSGHVFHLFVANCADRDDLRAFLEQRGIQTMIHYPVPVHAQGAYCMYNTDGNELGLTERHARTAVSLPMYPQMHEQEVHAVIDAIKAFYSPWR